MCVLCFILSFRIYAFFSVTARYKRNMFHDKINMYQLFWPFFFSILFDLTDLTLSINVCKVLCRHKWKHQWPENSEKKEKSTPNAGRTVENAQAFIEANFNNKNKVSHDNRTFAYFLHPEKKEPKSIWTLVCFSLSTREW